MTTRAFSAPTYIVSGIGALSEVAAAIDDAGAGRVAVVADRGVAENTQMLERLISAVGDRDYVVLPFVAPDPTVADAESAAVAAAEADCGAVVAIGGGSAIALAKAVCLLLRNPGPLLQYAGRDMAAQHPAPCIAIPTTAGSGSEVSNALVLHDPSLESIVVVRGRGYEPVACILDGELLKTLPDRPLVDAALDALSHALEAMWVKGRSAFTDAMAFAAADRIYKLLPRVLEQRRVEDLQGLLEVSTMANLACGPSGLGLVHALSSAARVHLPHGYQNGILLPHVASFNRSEVGPDVAAEIDRLPALYQTIGVTPTFKAGEIDEEQAASMVRIGMASPLHHNNVRQADAAELIELVAQAGVPRPPIATESIDG
jgi:alcohol dehydrogenase class IV